MFGVYGRPDEGVCRKIWGWLVVKSLSLPIYLRSEVLGPTSKAQPIVTGECVCVYVCVCMEACYVIFSLL